MERHPGKEWAEDTESGGASANGTTLLDCGGNWARMPRLMLANFAIMRALRAGWPDRFGGLYCEE